MLNPGNPDNLRRIDTKQIRLNSNDVLCFMVVRNESSRLPYLLTYYRQQGVSRFLIVDNHSTDETLSYLLEQPDVYLWHSDASFKENKLKWIQFLSNQYGLNHWCLYIDADEILYYPDCETRTIPELCQQLEKQNKDTLQAILLDMYSEKPIQETSYLPGENLVQSFPYFDRKFYHHKAGITKTYYWGGMRERIFGNSKRQKKQFLQTKFPLVKYNSKVVLNSIGFHHIKNAKVSSTTGCLLHFKYSASFTDYVVEAVKNQQYWNGGSEYEAYIESLQKNERLSLYDQDQSIRLENSDQLIKMGIMHRGVAFYPLPSFCIAFLELLHTATNLCVAMWRLIQTSISRQLGSGNG